MKKWTLFLSLYFCLCLLAACASSGVPIPDGTPMESESTYRNTTGEDAPQPEIITETFRIVTADGPGHPPLLLAKLDGAAGEICTLPSTQDSTVTLEWAAEGEMEAIDWSYQAGYLVEVTWDGLFFETYPAQFGSISALRVLDSGFDDRCALYLQVLEDLWEVDSGLNGGVEVIGVDLSQTSLSPAEQSAVAWAFAARHDAELAEGTLDNLIDQGYITGEPLGTKGAPEDAKFWHWENGCHFSITEQSMEGTYSLTPVTFDAQKWRSSLGAYWFCDCTSVQSALGKWGDYQIGSEMIS